MLQLMLHHKAFFATSCSPIAEGFVKARAISQVPAHLDEKCDQVPHLRFHEQAGGAAQQPVQLLCVALKSDSGWPLSQHCKLELPFPLSIPKLHGCPESGHRNCPTTGRGPQFSICSFDLMLVVPQHQDPELMLRKTFLSALCDRSFVCPRTKRC